MSNKAKELISYCFQDQVFQEIPFYKRAAVACILHVNNQTKELEVVYMKRANQKGDRWAGHLAFIGGKLEKDESDYEACLRETKEEIGWNLANRSQFQYLGRLDDREVKGSGSTKTVMVLSAFVFLCLLKEYPESTLSIDEVHSLYSIPLSYLVGADKDDSRWRPVHVDIVSHIFPPSYRRRASFLSFMVGGLEYHGIHPDEQYLFLMNDQQASSNPPPYFPIWGLTLWITTDLLKKLQVSKKATDLILMQSAPTYYSPDLEFTVSLLNGWMPRRLEVFLVRARLACRLSTIYAVGLGVAFIIFLRITILFMILRQIYFLFNF